MGVAFGMECGSLGKRDRCCLREIGTCMQGAQKDSYCREEWKQFKHSPVGN